MVYSVSMIYQELMCAQPWSLEMNWNPLMTLYDAAWPQYKEARTQSSGVQRRERLTILEGSRSSSRWVCKMCTYCWLRGKQRAGQAGGCRGWKDTERKLDTTEEEPGVDREKARRTTGVMNGRLGNLDFTLEAPGITEGFYVKGKWHLSTLF